MSLCLQRGDECIKNVTQSRSSNKRAVQLLTCHKVTSVGDSIGGSNRSRETLSQVMFLRGGSKTSRIPISDETQECNESRTKQAALYCRAEVLKCEQAQESPLAC